MINKLMLIISCTALIQSCNYVNPRPDVAKFEIINNSNNHLESLTISNQRTENTKPKIVYSLNPDELIKIEIDMTNVKGADGDYKLQYKINDTSYIKYFGYYTNGSQTENLISISVISADSVLIEQ